MQLNKVPDYIWTVVTPRGRKSFTSRRELREFRRTQLVDVDADDLKLFRYPVADDAEPARL